MAYDAAARSVVLFGGDNGRSALAGRHRTGTADLDEAGPLRPARPPGEFASMAYDSVAGNVVLFGGQNGGPGSFNDTWTWGSG